MNTTEATTSETAYILSTERPDPLPDIDPVTGRPRPPEGCLPEIGEATDLDASLRFAAANHDVLRYCPGVGWLHWSGSYWETDKDGASAIELSKQCARRWTDAALKAFRKESIEHNRKLLKTALALEGACHLRAAADLARSDPRIAIGSDHLDRDPWKLCVLNVVVTNCLILVAKPK